MGHDDVGRGEPRWWQRSAGRHESFESVPGGGRLTTALLLDDVLGGRQQGSQEGRQVSPDGSAGGDES